MTQPQPQAGRREPNELLAAGLKADESPDLRTYLRRAFDMDELDEGETIAIVTASEYDGKTVWPAVSGTDKRLKSMAGSKSTRATYFCVSTVKLPEDGARPTRRRDDLRKAYVVALDDVGNPEKVASVPPVEPSAKLETSAGNFQWHYFINPYDVSTPDGLAYYEGCLEALAAAKLTDTGALGANRIMRMPGSVNTKPGRDSFETRVTGWHPDRVWDLDVLMEDFGLEPKPKSEHVKTTGTAPPDMNDVLDALKHIDPNCDRPTWLKVGMALKTVTDDPTLFDQWSSGQLTGIETPVNYVQEHIYQQWPGFKPGGDDKINIGSLFGLAIEAGWRNFDTAPAFGATAGSGRKGIIEQRLADGSVVGALMQNPTEDNVALAFGEIYDGEYIYMTGPRCWFRWDGTRWRRDELQAVREVVRRLARAHNVGGKAAPAKNSFITGLLGIAQSDPRFSRLVSNFDQDNYLLNCPDGTYDLSGATVTRHEHRPGDHITKLTAVSPQPGGGGRFLQFLQEIFDKDAELIGWVQRALGACLSGAVEDHWLMFWTGAGRNGKNTLGDLVMRILGDYAKAVPADTLMSKKNQEHKTEIVNLMGVRLAVASEIEESDFWAESKLKSLTGDAMLSGRYMYKDFVDFERTHKHLIYGNHRPQLRNIDAALRARMKVVPFRESFLGREDGDLGAKLWAESSFVLHWLIEGHRGWLAMGKKVGSCAAIEEEVEEYLSEQVTVDNWVEQFCRRVPDDGRDKKDWPRASELYSSYKYWSAEMGAGVKALPKFTASLRKLGFTRARSDGIRYCGIELIHPNTFGPSIHR